MTDSMLDIGSLVKKWSKEKLKWRGLNYPNITYDTYGRKDNDDQSSNTGVIVVGPPI